MDYLYKIGFTINNDVSFLSKLLSSPMEIFVALIILPLEDCPGLISDIFFNDNFNTSLSVINPS